MSTDVDPVVDPVADLDEEEQCASTRTVQVGPMAAIDLRCTLRRWAHAEPLHFTTRSFGDVQMSAHWHGEFEPGGASE